MQSYTKIFYINSYKGWFYSRGPLQGEARSGDNVPPGGTDYEPQRKAARASLPGAGAVDVADAVEVIIDGAESGGKTGSCYIGDGERVIGPAVIGTAVVVGLKHFAPH